MREPAKPSPGSGAAKPAGSPEPQPPARTVRLARKTQSLDILYEVAISLSQTGNLEQLLHGFLDTFIDLIDARAASVRLVTADGNTHMIASRGLTPEVAERDRLMPAGRCMCGWSSTVALPCPSVIHQC